MSKNKYETDEGYELFVSPLEAYMKNNPAKDEEELDTYEYTQNTINRGRKFAKHRPTSFDTLYAEWSDQDFEGWPLKKLDDETTKEIQTMADSMNKVNVKYWDALPIKPIFKVKGVSFIDVDGDNYSTRMNEKNVKNWTVQAKENGSLWKDQSSIKTKEA